MHAAVATLGAYYHKLLTGEGQHVDVSIQECLAAILEMNFMHWTYAGKETSRLGRRSIYPWCMLDCKDGKVFVVNVEEDQWQRMVELMDNPEWATLDDLQRSGYARPELRCALSVPARMGGKLDGERPLSCRTRASHLLCTGQYDGRPLCL